MSTSNGIAVLLLISALVAAGGFVGTYASFAPWRSNEAGKTVMLLAVSMIFLILTLILLNVFGTDYLFRDALRLGTYALLNVALWRQLIVLVRVQSNRSARSAETSAAGLPAPRASVEAEDKRSVI